MVDTFAKRALFTARSSIATAGYAQYFCSLLLDRESLQFTKRNVRHRL